MTEHLMTRRDEIATALISTWVVTGLFVDGWAHNADKPETFFTPWHGVLYSGFVAGGLWGLYERRRSSRLGQPVAPMPRSMKFGFGLFAAGGVLDMVWHQIFGIEVDLEALLSPTHLMLMIGGLLLVTPPVRSALARGDRTLSLRQFAPVLVGATLAIAVVGFFLQFASAFRIEGHGFFDAGATDGERVHGITSVLLSNALMLGAVAWLLRHFRPPIGAFTLLFGATALALTGLQGFDEAVLVLPALVGGAVADALVARRRSVAVVLTATPAVLWTAWFATYHVVWDLGWTVELWTGAIVLAGVTGYGLSLLARDPVHLGGARAGTGERGGASRRDGLVREEDVDDLGERPAREAVAVLAVGGPDAVDIG